MQFYMSVDAIIMNLKSLKPEMGRITRVCLGLRSFELLPSVFWWWLTDVLEQPIGPFFRGFGPLEP